MSGLKVKKWYLRILSIICMHNVYVLVGIEVKSVVRVGS